MVVVPPALAVPAPGPRAPVSFPPLLLVAVYLTLAGLAGPVTAPAQEGVQGRVVGRIQGNSQEGEIAGVRVMLVRFTLDEEGNPRGSPIEIQPTSPEGRYTFTGVPIDRNAVYQLGARVQGMMVSSDPFTFPEGHREVMLNLKVPEVSSGAESLRVEEALLAIEPRRGAVWVTEVLHLMNPTPNVMRGTGEPLELTVPPGAEQFEMLRQDIEEADHEYLGTKLLVYGNFMPGNSTVAFRYRLPVWLGAFTLAKRYPHPVQTLSVLTPLHSVQVSGENLERVAAQTIDGQRYDTRRMGRIAADEAVSLAVSGVPVRQELFLLPTTGFFVLMAGVVFWFVRRRLPAEGEATPGTEAEPAPGEDELPGSAQ